MTPIEQHNFDVRNVQAQMKDFYARGQKVKIYHGSTTSSRAQKFEKDKFVDVSRLDRVIEINTIEQYILVEPNVPMDKLVEETLRHRLVPPVIMELPGITVGGGIQGGAGESGSFKYGLFHDTCLEYEIVLGNGELITASPTKNEDLFYGTACSYGSLGVITLVKLRLVPAKDYVHLTYHNVKSFDEAINLTEKKIGEAVQFVDGIIFSKNRGIIMVGNFADKTELPISTFRKRSDDWFYMHADKISKHYEKYDEIIPIKDYLFRYDRGAFWTGHYFFKFYKIPFLKILRYILDGILNTRMLIRLAHGTNMTQRYFVQDLSMPRENTLTFLNYIDERLGIYPLWLCPLRPGKKDKFSPNCLETNLVINVGVWGEASREYSDFVRENRDVENRVMELRGRKVLYAHAYYPRDEFWKIYDHTWYNVLRDKYFADKVFPDIYDKTKVTEKYKPSVIIGLWNALRSEKIPIS